MTPHPHCAEMRTATMRVIASALLALASTLATTFATTTTGADAAAADASTKTQAAGTSTKCLRGAVYKPFHACIEPAFVKKRLSSLKSSEQKFTRVSAVDDLGERRGATRFSR